MWNPSSLGFSCDKQPSISEAFLQHFRIPRDFACFHLTGDPGPESGYFRFGDDATCYGRSTFSSAAEYSNHALSDASGGVVVRNGCVYLPFDPTEIIDNLRLERYPRPENAPKAKRGLDSWVRGAYYMVRPFLPPTARSALQRIHLRDWEKIAFPNWPLDCSVDNLFESLMTLALTAAGGDAIPFIWFWPRSASGCFMMTHDVETSAGRDYCGLLMDIDDAYGVKSSFQIVPEKRYAVSDRLLDSFRERGFEVNVHDLNHDGCLFQDPAEFQRRAGHINRYVREFDVQGFRSGAMYRNADWVDALNISYDMSVPNVAHLEPQRGGCCTVMPYFIGNILELPLTAMQDYSMFSILRRYSIAVWERQMNLILEKNGLVSFIVHPDYIIEHNAQAVYEDLLQYASELCEQRNVWRALPSQVNAWWRQRDQMTLVRENDGWTIEGEGSERATVAYAELVNGRLTYSFEPVPASFPASASLVGA